MDKGLFERVSKRIEDYKDEMIELQRKLVRTPAIAPESGGVGELEKSKIIETMAKGLFDEVETFRAPDDSVSCGYRPNIAAKIKGKDNERTIWIMSHMDVVPAGDEKKWTTNPFELTIKDGCLYGRGVEDNHLGIVSSIFAAKALKEEGVTPTFNMGTLFVSEEETGSKYGARYLLDKHPNIFGPADLIIIPDYGNKEGSIIEVAEKSILWLKVITQGKQAHASHPERGVNAHRAAAHLICKMDQLYKKYSTENSVYEPPINTFEATMKEKNISNFNAVPGEDITCFDCRMIPPLTIDEVLSVVKGYAREIEEEFKVKIDFEIPFRSDAANPTPADSQIVRLIENAAKEIFNVKIKPIGIGGQTVATWFRNKGFHVAVYSRTLSNEHEPDERCPISYMTDNTKLLAHVLMQ